VRRPDSHDEIYILDRENEQWKRHWVKYLTTLHDLGFSGSDAQRVATDEFYSYDDAVIISDESM
jgi:hypothetical protein